MSRHFPEIERERTNKPRTGNMARVGGWRFSLTLEDGILHHSRENGPKKTHSWTKAEGRDRDCRGRGGVSRAGEHSGLPQKGQHGVLACCAAHSKPPVPSVWSQVPLSLLCHRWAELAPAAFASSTLVPDPAHLCFSWYHCQV